MFKGAFSCLLIAAAVLCTLQSQSTESKLENFLYTRCREYASSAATYDLVHQRMQDFLSYLKYTTNLLPNGKEQFCKDERPLLIRNARVLAQEAKSCFPKEEKYLPKYIESSFTQFVNFLCTNGIDNFFSTQGRDCLDVLGKANSSHLVSGCFSSFIKPSNQVTPDIYCKDLSMAETCFDTVLLHHCENFRGFRSLNTQLFRSLKTPCGTSGARQFVMTYLLLLLTIASTYIL